MTKADAAILLAASLITFKALGPTDPERQRLRQAMELLAKAMGL